MNRDKTIIDTNVYGAGSTVNTGNSLPAGKLARISGIPHKYGRLFYDMCRKYKPATIIELGTGLGISTYYLAKGNPDSSVITVEGSFEKTNYAKSMLENEGISNVKFFTGNFDELTEMTTSYISHPLLVFIDGNHTYEPTVRYFNFYLQYAKENTIIIFDDIHWSDEMEKAWKLISNHEKVSISIDLFRCGIVFFGKKYPEGIF